VSDRIIFSTSLFYARSGWVPAATWHHLRAYQGRSEGKIDETVAFLHDVVARGNALAPHVDVTGFRGTRSLCRASPPFAPERYISMAEHFVNTNPLHMKKIMLLTADNPAVYAEAESMEREKKRYFR